MGLKVITPPATEPVTLADAKKHLNIDITFMDDDNYISGLITAARDLAESIQGRAYVEQTLELTLDTFPAVPFDLPRAPLKSVMSITYKDSAGTEQTFSDYVMDTATEPGRIALKANTDWPNVDLYPLGGVKIQYIAGGYMPAKVKQAILLLISHWYENREAVAVGAGITATELPLAVEALLWADRLVRF